MHLGTLFRWDAYWKNVNQRQIQITYNYRKWVLIDHVHNFIFIQR